MTTPIVAFVAAVAFLVSVAAAQPTTRPAGPLAFVMKDIDGNDHDLAQYHGKVVMMVNVASRCGFTRQYAGLEQLYRKYQDQGLVLIGFPANNFGSQEPGTDAEIKEFCAARFGVTFPMMSKISVKGDDIHPLYAYLTRDSGHPGDIGWNFNKFLVGRDGKVIARYPSKVEPDDKQLLADIEAALAAK